MAGPASMLRLSENEGIEGTIFVVTGGLDCVGAALCLELVRRGAEDVRCFDSRASSPWLASLKRNRVDCITGDVRKREHVEKALKGANCVFHLVSYGISGKEMLQARHIDEINLDGTCNVLDSCIKAGVERLVFLSSYSVVFGGQEIINGNEAVDYFPLENQINSYGRSKSLAEQLVLKSNARPLKGRTQRKLYTCAIRPAYVYGPGEEHHVPRILSLVQRVPLSFVVGGPNVQTDWVYVDNLVHALLRASMGLIDDIPGRKWAPAAGQTYFISDGTPRNSFAFFRPLIESLGYQFPALQINLKHATIIAWIFWGFYGLFYPWLDKWWLPQPLILPAEVHKVGVTHYFSIIKARQHLQYVPFIDPQDGMKCTIEYWKAKQAQDLESPPWYYWVLIFIGLFGLLLSAFMPTSSLGPFEWFRSLNLFFFRSKGVMQIIAYMALLAHFGEAVYAWFLARKLDRVNAKGWFLQTLALGFPSLTLLVRRCRKRASID
eukprot:c21842_g1_i1 orf=186-1661(+)